MFPMVPSVQFSTGTNVSAAMCAFPAPEATLGGKLYMIIANHVAVGSVDMSSIVMLNTA